MADKDGKKTTIENDTRTVNQMLDGVDPKSTEVGINAPSKFWTGVGEWVVKKLDQINGTPATPPKAEGETAPKQGGQTQPKPRARSGPGGMG